MAHRSAEHRRAFEFHLLDLITGALCLDRLKADKDLQDPHYEKAATLIRAAYAAVEMRFPAQFKKFFGRETLEVDAVQLKKAYTRHLKRRFKDFFGENPQ